MMMIIITMMMVTMMIKIMMIMIMFLMMITIMIVMVTMMMMMMMITMIMMMYCLLAAELKVILTIAERSKKQTLEIDTLNVKIEDLVAQLGVCKVWMH